MSTRSDDEGQVTRRAFVRASAAASLIAPLAAGAPKAEGTPTPADGPTSAPAQTPAQPRAIRKSVKIGMVAGDQPLVEKFQLLADLGFDGVELDSPGPYAVDEVNAARERTGLVVHGVVCSEHWRSPLSDPDPAVRARCRAAMETALRDSRDVGGTTVLLVPAVVNKTVSYADAYTRSQDELRAILPYAEEIGITIALENVWNQFLLSPLEAARYVDELDSPALGWYFDVGNVVNYGWPEQWVRVLGPRIRKIDVKEFSRTKRDAEGLWKGFNVELLEGDCDWPAVMAALDEIGYQGWATAEIAGGDRERLADIARRMETILSAP